MAQLSFWGNYLPHVYPVHLRGTGESFAANIGGRLIGTSAAALAAYVAGLMPYATSPLQFSAAAAIVGTSVYVIGFFASFFLPEPQLPELHERLSGMPAQHLAVSMNSSLLVAGRGLHYWPLVG